MARWLIARIGFLLLITLLAGAGLWYSAPTLVEQLAYRAARDAGLKDFSLSVAALGLTALKIDHLAFSTDSPSGPLSIELFNATAHLDNSKTGVARLEIASARADYIHHPVEAAAESEPLVVPGIPLSSLTIANFELTAMVGEQQAHLEGRLDLVQPRTGRFELDFVQPPHRLALDLQLEPLEFHLALSRNQQAPFATLDHPSDETRPVSIDTNLPALLDWVRTTQWLPIAPGSLAGLSLENGHLNMDADQPLTTDRLHARGRLSVTGLVFGDKHIDADLPIDVRRDHERFELEVFDTARATADIDSAHTHALTLSRNYQIVFDLDDEGLEHAKGHGEARIDSSFAGTGVAATVNQWAVGAWTRGVAAPDSLSMDISGLSGAALPEKLPAIDLNGTWIRTKEALDGKGKAYIGHDIPVTWHSRHALENGRSAINIRIDEPAATLWPAIQPLLSDREQLMQISDGHTLLHIDADWRPDSGLAMKGTLRLKAIDAHIEALGLNDADFSFEIDDLIARSGRFDIRIPSATLANGLETGPIDINGTLTGDRADLTKASIEVYSGVLSIRPTRLAMDQPASEMIVDITGLDLGALLADFGPPDLALSATIDGSVPISWSSSGSTIVGALMETRGAGFIRYRPAAAQALGGSHNVGLQALDNFQYERFQAEADYEASGDYRIGLNLNGRNPDLYGGHPIELNLNLDGNLPGFLRASIISGDFTGEIIKSLRDSGTLPAQ